MADATVLEEKDSLPGAKLHFPIGNRDGLARSRQHHSNVRGHIVRTLVLVLKVIDRFGNESIEELLQIAPRRWRRILHHDKTATGVLNKRRERAYPYTGFIDLRLQLVGDFIGTLAARSNFEQIRPNAHNWATKVTPV